MLIQSVEDSNSILYMYSSVCLLIVYVSVFAGNKSCVFECVTESFTLFSIQILYLVQKC